MQSPVIGIIGGHGRMGHLFAEFFKKHGIKVLLSDIKTKLSNPQLAKKADIVIISVPIDKTKQTIEEVSPYMQEDSALMDLTSVKEMPVKTMLKAKCEVMGMHPMFGNSNPIPGQTIILCPTKKSAKWSKWMQKFLKSAGAKIVTMTPKEHDKTMSIAQGIIHFADITFADGIRRLKTPIKDIYKFASPASQLKGQLAARLIDQDPGLYASMQIENPHNLKALSQYKKAIDELYKIVKKKDKKAFVKYFKNNKSFLGKYTKEAYEDSSYLIDKFFEKKQKQSTTHSPLPQKRDLATLGPKNTFSDLAANIYSATSPKFYAQSIEEVFDLVAKSKVKEGIVPIENKIHGTVRETLDNLFTHALHITKETILPIEHSLFIRSGAKKSQIKRVISHPQALNQCKKYLKKNFPKAVLEGSPSTAAAKEKLLSSKDNSIAVIAAPIPHPELKIFSKNIANQKDNSTTFITISRTPNSEEGNKTSIAFYFSADSPGTLSGVFAEFAKAKINLTKIESRPTQEKFGDYIFYLDFQASITSPKTQKILKTLKEKVAELKVLGCY